MSPGNKQIQLSNNAAAANDDDVKTLSSDSKTGIKQMQLSNEDGEKKNGDDGAVQMRRTVTW